MKLLCSVVLFAVVAATLAQLEPQDEAGPFPDYWQDSDEAFYDYPEDNSDTADSKDISIKQEDTDKLVEAEIQDFREQNEALGDPNESSLADDGSVDEFADYQFEDNRSDADNKESDTNEDSVPDEEPMPDDAPEINPVDVQVLPLEPREDETSKENNNGEDAALDDEMWGDVFDEAADEDIAPLPVPSEDKEESLEEELAAAEQDAPNSDEKSSENAKSEETSVERSDLDQIVEETKKILEETDNEFNYDDYAINSDAVDKSLEDLVADSDDDTPEKVLEDLNDDLDKLLETLDKLSENDSDIGENEDKEENNDKENDVDEVQDYEEKYGRPFREGYILSLRDDYDNFDDSNLPDIFAENAEDASDESSEEDTPNEDDEVAEQEEDDAAAADNASLDENNNGPSTTQDADDQEKLEVLSEDSNSSNQESFDYTDDLDKLFNAKDEDDEEIDNLFKDLWRHSYGNDGLVDDQQEINVDAEVMSTTGSVPNESIVTESVSTEAAPTENTPESETTEADEPRSTIMVENLNSAEYNDLMTQFAMTHSEDLDVNGETFLAKNVAPIHITLSVDEPTVITSPNYPNPYPTNNIVDWIFEGPGTGIEMNVTDFFVNGVVGDYMLVKPGGVDASGNDGLIFSFRLTRERKYRFTNVNRMFVRFESHNSQLASGFSFSVKLIWPLPDIEQEEEPKPEAVLQPPRSTITLSLAGMTMREFNAIKPTFKELVADMAQEYITDNNIDPGVNTTLEVTQITRVSVCNIRWPNYETCVEVVIGVPLHYDEEVEAHRLNAGDLDDMWRTYIVREPYATRLRELGITEYAIPDDRTVLMLWLVIALGVVIAVSMLAFALWRFRCFEDYTRMMAYSDTDSVQKEKKNLDLYPTPHQALPPLYADGDYKWADDKYDDSTRVDMGGFANKSYVRDDLFDFDSDEDVITPHDRKPDVISPRDVYEV